ncbi:hypothetical protein SAE02_76720 [Skermanella aerolata]|uniref:DUF2188 domain-containing protein n=1 Tax=Skermanella aerolata TaxID=393310 RepID=A0A512E453_9PROT|nr:DUF2188 domain-containing protein [Skermanella aerolata]GEO43524.1 hypothetical protein SAE02_76720 [Skermanella aerolata]
MDREGRGQCQSYVCPPRQQEAIDTVRGITINHGSKMLIHGRNGQIREHNTYGNASYPPKG